MPATKSIPVQFVPGYLAVNEVQAFEMLGLNDGRTERAKKAAFKRMRDAFGIPTLPGGVFPLKKIEQAVSA
jgi:hypothetical protein